MDRTTVGQDDLEPIGAAARRARVSSEYLRRLANDGRVPFVRTPLGRLFKVSDIEHFRAEREAAKAAKSA